MAEYHCTHIWSQWKSSNRMALDALWHYAPRKNAKYSGTEMIYTFTFQLYRALMCISGIQFRKPGKKELYLDA